MQRIFFTRVLYHSLRNSRTKYHIVGFVLLSLCLFSCIDKNIDLNNLSTQIYIGEKISLPLIKNGKINLRKALSDNTGIFEIKGENTEVLVLCSPEYTKTIPIPNGQTEYPFEIDFKKDPEKDPFGKYNKDSTYLVFSNPQINLHLEGIPPNNLSLLSLQLKKITFNDNKNITINKDTIIHGQEFIYLHLNEFVDDKSLFNTKIEKIKINFDINSSIQGNLTIGISLALPLAELGEGSRIHHCWEDTIPKPLNNIGIFDYTTDSISINLILKNKHLPPDLKNMKAIINGIKILDDQKDTLFFSNEKIIYEQGFDDKKEEFTIVSGNVSKLRKGKMNKLELEYSLDSLEGATIRANDTITFDAGIVINEERTTTDQ